MTIKDLIDARDHKALKKLITEQPLLVHPNATFYALEYAASERDTIAFEIILNSMIEHSYINKDNQENIRRIIEDFWIGSSLFRWNTAFNYRSCFQSIPCDFVYYHLWLRSFFLAFIEVSGSRYTESSQNTIMWFIKESKLDLNFMLLEIITGFSKEDTIVNFLNAQFNRNRFEYSSKKGEIFRNIKTLKNQFGNREFPLLAYCYHRKYFKVCKFLLDNDYAAEYSNRHIELCDILNTYESDQNLEVITQFIQKLGGPQKLKKIKPCVLEHSIISARMSSIKLLLNLGYSLEDTIPGDNKTYLALCAELSCTALNESCRRVAFSILKIYTNIMDSKLWEKANLAEAAFSHEWELCEILLKLNHDPLEIDLCGRTAMDAINRYQNSGLQRPKETLEVVFRVKELLIKAIGKSPKAKELDSIVILTTPDSCPEVDVVLSERNKRKRDLFDKAFKIFQWFSEFNIRFNIFFKDGKKSFRNYIPLGKIESDQTFLTELHPIIFREGIKELLIPGSQNTERLKKLYEEIWGKLKSFNRYKDFCSEAETFWSKDLKERLEIKRDINNLLAFNLNQFSLYYWTCSNFYEFCDNFIGLIKMLNSPEYKEFSSGLCYSSINNHHAVLWSLTLRSSKRYFNSKLDKKTRIEEIEILGIKLKFRDWRNAKNYKLVVHTTSGHPDKLSKTLASDADFIHTTPFFSCSFIDKDIPPALMDHQEKIIFPFSLILELEDDAVIKAFYMDAWSPMLTRYAKEHLEEISGPYKSNLKQMDTQSNLLEQILRSQTSPSQQEISKQQLTHTAERPNLSELDADFILNTMFCSEYFSLPSASSHGYMPRITPLQTLKLTHSSEQYSHFNELIVAGKPKNKILGILVDDNLLQHFLKQISENDTSAEYAKKLELMKRSLNLLAQTKYPLILVRSQHNGYENKKSLFVKYQDVKSKLNDSLQKGNELFLREYHLKKTKRTENLDNLEELTESIQALTAKIDKFKEKLTEIEFRISGKHSAFSGSRI